MKTVKQPNAINKLFLLLGEQIFVGVDVHKLTRHVALWSRERGLLGSWVQPSDANVLERHLSRIEPAMLRIVYEAGPPPDSVWPGGLEREDIRFKSSLLTNAGRWWLPFFHRIH